MIAEADLCVRLFLWIVYIYTNIHGHGGRHERSQNS